MTGRPSTPTSAMGAFAERLAEMERRIADIERAVGTGTAWRDYTPVISQGATSNIAKTIVRARYAVRGFDVLVMGDLLVTGAGSAGSTVNISLPVTASRAGYHSTGNMLIYRTSTDTAYNGEATLNTATQIVLQSDGAAGGWGVAPSVALANGDIIRFNLTYEAA